MPHPDLAWALWLGISLAVFAVLEAWALLAGRTGKTPSTLTATLRRWLGIHPKRRHRHLLGAVLLGFLIWFAGHILAGWPP